VLSGFVFDEPIPAEQFSVDPPKGYKREEGAVMGIERR
jgi:hypothetical protein